MTTMPERIIAVIDEDTKNTRLGEDADAHLKRIFPDLGLKATVDFIGEVTRKVNKHLKFIPVKDTKPEE